MTIDEVIEKHRKIAETQKILYDACVLKECNKHFLREAEEHEQIAEWLEELKELREKNETLKALYKDVKKEANNLLKCGRNKAIDDLRNELKNHYTEYNIDCVLEDNDFYSYTTACNYLEDYIDEIAEQLKAGGKE